MWIVKKRVDGVKWLTLAYHRQIRRGGAAVGIKVPTNLTTTGFIDGEANNADTNSFQVIGKMGLKALKDGNSAMVVTKENWHRSVLASGWGIGTYVVAGGNWDNGKMSGGGGGGTGYSKNKTGPEDMPWCHAYVGVINGQVLLTKEQLFE